MYLNHPTKNDVGYWWVNHPSYKKLFIIELRWETWDHTRDGDRFEIHDGDEIIEFGNHEWYNYNFIKKVREPSVYDA